MSDIPIELKKEFNLEDENEKKTDIEKIIVDNKTVIYSIVFYACSLAIGTVLYRLLQSSALDSVLKPSNANFSKLFSQNICNNLIADFKSISHFLLFFLTFLLRTNHHKIHKCEQHNHKNNHLYAACLLISSFRLSC